MIRYRPRRANLSAEVKDEQIFESLNEMFGYLFDHWNRIFSFIGSYPVNRSDILLDANYHVFMNRKDKSVCIGVYEE